MPLCEYCGSTEYCVSSYNPDKKMECPRCRRKRIDIDESMSKETLLKKIDDSHRELHCLKSSNNAISAMLDVEQRKFKKAKDLLKRWSTYGEHTHCKSIPLINETKEILNI